jgi:hypothetical protein
MWREEKSMARYQIPPDPREGEQESPHAHRVKKKPRSSPPWLWIGLGAIVTVLAIAVAVLWARVLLGGVDKLEEEPTPTITIQTAVPTQPSTPTVDAAEPTVSPEADVTSEPAPTPEPVEEQPTPIPPGVIAVGVRVTVVGTEGIGVSLRAGPGTNYARLDVARDGAVLEIIDGPEEADGYTWWSVRTADGTEAWAIDNYFQVP